MPPRRERADPVTLAEIGQRLASIEERIGKLESGPHNGCPSPVLAQRIATLEEWQKQQNGKLQHILDKIDANKSERFEQIEGVRKEMAAQIGDVLTAVNDKKQQGWTRAQAIFVGIISLLGGAVVGLLVTLVSHAILH